MNPTIGDERSFVDLLADRYPDVSPETLQAVIAATRVDERSAGAAPVLGSAADLGEALNASLEDLSMLAMGDLGLADMLTHIAEFAVNAIPGADGAGLTLFQHDRPDTVVATAPFVRQIDEIQYDLAEGPCISAAATRRTVRSGSLEADVDYPRFGIIAGGLGVHSVLSLPLLIGERTLGSMNVYARRPDAFDDRSVLLGEMFAVPAAISVDNARTLAQARLVASKLQSSLDNASGEVTAALAILVEQLTHGGPAGREALI